jgi:hypothetical protein
LKVSPIPTRYTYIFAIQAGGERLSMAYMDVPPEGDSNGRTEGSKKQRTEETP